MTHVVWEYVDGEWRGAVTTDRDNAWGHARAMLGSRPDRPVVVLPDGLTPARAGDLARYTPS